MAAASSPVKGVRFTISSELNVNGLTPSFVHTVSAKPNGTTTKIKPISIDQNPALLIDGDSFVALFLKSEKMTLGARVTAAPYITN
jgi:hypothetical protein